jgi:predicted SAM-dependent methyltransferase
MNPAAHQSTSPRLLHLGCGLTAPAEWVNVDGSWNAWFAKRPRLRRALSAVRLVPRSQTAVDWPTNVQRADLRGRLPFPDASFDAVFSSHTLEHLHRSEAVRLLRESYRVLKPGGRVRGVVPDLRAIVEEYLGTRTLAEPRHADDRARQMCDRLLMRPERAPHRGAAYAVYSNLTDFHSHKWMYDGDSLVKLFEEAGFLDCRVRGFRESNIPHIDKVESPGRVLDGQGVPVEGRRP